MEPLKILSPCHGAPIYVTVSGYTGDTTIWCDEKSCANSWDSEGDPE